VLPKKNKNGTHLKRGFTLELSCIYRYILCVLFESFVLDHSKETLRSHRNRLLLLRLCLVTSLRLACTLAPHKLLNFGLLANQTKQ